MQIHFKYFFTNTTMEMTNSSLVSFCMQNIGEFIFKMSTMIVIFFKGNCSDLSRQHVTQKGYNNEI